jgi:hypothetical protein
VFGFILAITEVKIVLWIYHDKDMKAANKMNDYRVQMLGMYYLTFCNKYYGFQKTTEEKQLYLTFCNKYYGFQKTTEEKQLYLTFCNKYYGFQKTTEEKHL